MRLDKFLSDMAVASRSESAKAARAGRITVNGVPVNRADGHIDPEKDTVALDGVQVVYRRFNYIMMNKPEGYVSSTDDPRETTVLELLPDNMRKLNLFPCGRLDKDAVGLLLLTDNGVLAHRLLSPKRHVAKVYRVVCARDVEGVEALEEGITLADGYTTMPAKYERTDARSGYLTIGEGKYHQVKRMFAALGNHVSLLERVGFGPLTLDTSLKRGEWRYLTVAETEMLETAGGSEKAKKTTEKGKDRQ